MSPSSVPTGVASVSKTAHDALQAKYSAAVHGGYTHQHHPDDTTSETYHRLLRLAAETTGATRRQTPLVHAGYAVRTNCILEHIHRFVEYHSCTNAAASSSTNCQPKLQVVVLGAGLDVTGMSLVLSVSDVHVVDVDMSDVCQTKTNILSVLPELLLRSHDALQRSYTLQQPESSSSSSSSHYTLVTADLSDKESLERVRAAVDPTIPTLVLSELVVSYMGELECNRLLEWCATRLLVGLPTSVFLAYEPLGPQSLFDNNDEPSQKECPPSVLEAYKRAYYQTFLEKLDRGTAGHCKNVQADKDRPRVGFYPLAHSCTTMERRFRAHGFERACASTAGAAVSDFPLSQKEPFDEHAELMLHLQTYVLVCSFSLPGDRLFQRYLCPWTTGFRPKMLSTKFDDSVQNAIWLTTMEVEDESQVRELFSESYKHLVDEYPSIGKMVKAALGKDLALTLEEQRASQIRQGYVEKGGDFLVAVRQNEQRRHVVGGIGIRECTAAELKARKFHPSAGQSHSAYYEIHRLFVGQPFRSHKIATELLNAAMSICPSSSVFVATTPAILEGANKFYPSRGFDLHESVSMGELKMHTYIFDKNEASLQKVQ